MLTNILINTNLAQNLSFGIAKILSKIFKIPLSSTSTVVIGFLLGYPNSAKFISKLYSEHKITKHDCEVLLAFTSNANPSYIISTIGLAFYSNISIGLILAISHFLSAFILGILLSLRNRYIILQNSTNLYSNFKKTSHSAFNIITESMLQTLKTLGLMFCFMTIFSLFSQAICSFLKLSETNSSIVTSVVEITNGLYNLSCSSLTLEKKILLSSFALSFGSLMILYQIFSYVINCKLSFWIFLKHKLIHGILSLFLTYILLKVIPIKEISYEVFSNISTNTLQVHFPELVYIFSIILILIYLLFKQKKKRLKLLTASSFKGDNV
ncbi:MAG: hypothetical protein IKV94_00905 [Clostridia bacterium]|nr:hypothetical protein [Clostridia bacterium]